MNSFDAIVALVLFSMLFLMMESLLIPRWAFPLPRELSAELSSGGSPLYWQFLSLNETGYVGISRVFWRGVIDESKLNKLVDYLDNNRSELFDKLSIPPDSKIRLFIRDYYDKNTKLFNYDDGYSNGSEYITIYTWIGVYEGKLANVELWVESP